MNVQRRLQNCLQESFIPFIQVSEVSDQTLLHRGQQNFSFLRTTPLRAQCGQVTKPAEPNKLRQIFALMMRSGGIGSIVFIVEQLWNRSISILARVLRARTVPSALQYPTSKTLLF